LQAKKKKKLKMTRVNGTGLLDIINLKGGNCGLWQPFQASQPSSWPPCQRQWWEWYLKHRHQTDDLNYINSLSDPLGSFLFLKQIYKSILYAQCGLFLRVIMQVCLHTWDQFVSMRLRAMWAKAMLTNY
jgi:hypothetical protein